MTFQDRPTTSDTAGEDRETQASQALIRKLFGPWSEANERDLQSKLDGDPAFASAFQNAERTWAGVGKHATSPELMALREQALSRARRSNRRRWSLPIRPWWQRAEVRVLAAAAGLLLLLAGAYQWLPFGFRPGEYRTKVAEQSVIELADHSRVALDAATRLRVRFTDDARIVELLEGQAQFAVAKDPRRPFKVQVGERTIVALGTKFTVEYIDREFNIAMLEGRVAVITDLTPAEASARSARAADQQTEHAASNRTQLAAASEHAATNSPVAATPAHVNNTLAGIIELSAGEGLQIDKGGAATLIPSADLKAVNAWREGKVIFKGEPLQEAVRRLNRYSTLRIELSDPALASMRVSGVFDTGDTQAFVEAVQGSIGVVADYSEQNTIRLKPR